MGEADYLPEDGRGAEHLNKLKPIHLALRILGGRHKFDKERGLHLVDNHIVTVQEVFQAAGMEVPH